MKTESLLTMVTVILVLVTACALRDVGSASCAGCLGYYGQDSCGIQQQLDAIPNGGIVDIGPRTCCLSTPLLMRSNQTLRGAGRGTTQICFAGNSAAVITADPAKAPHSNIAITDLSLIISNQYAQNIGIEMNQWIDSQVARVAIAAETPSYPGTTIGISIAGGQSDAYFNVLDDVRVTCKADGVNIVPGTVGIQLIGAAGKPVSTSIRSSRVDYCARGIYTYKAPATAVHQLHIQNACVATHIKEGGYNYFTSMQGEGMCYGAKIESQSKYNFIEAHWDSYSHGYDYEPDPIRHPGVKPWKDCGAEGCAASAGRLFTDAGAGTRFVHQNTEYNNLRILTTHPTLKLDDNSGYGTAVHIKNQSDEPVNTVVFEDFTRGRNLFSIGRQGQIFLRGDTTQNPNCDPPSIRQGSGTPTMYAPKGSLYVNTATGQPTLYVMTSSGWEIVK